MNLTEWMKTAETKRLNTIAAQESFRAVEKEYGDFLMGTIGIRLEDSFDPVSLAKVISKMVEMANKKEGE